MSVVISRSRREYNVLKLAAFSKTNDIALADVTGLSFPIAASEVWIVEWHFDCTYAAAGEFKVDVTGPAAPTAVSVCCIANCDGGSPEYHSTTSFSSALEMQFTGATTACCTRVRCAVVNGANAGTIQLRFAQRALSGTASTIAALARMRAVLGTTVA